MNIKFTYSIGNIEEILNGNSEKYNSIEEIPIIKDSQRLSNLNFIGVYQEDKEKKMKSDEDFEDLVKTFLNEQHIKNENAHPDLICVIYDPSMIDFNLTKKYIKKRSLFRLKIEQSLYFPDFDKKTRKIKEFENFFRKMIKKTIEEDIEKSYKFFIKAEEVLKHNLKNYGLTRIESLYQITFEKIASDLDYPNEFY